MRGLEEQSQAFDLLRDRIDCELRSTGFEEFLYNHGLDPARGRLVVGRSFIHTNSRADIDTDLDPLAKRLATQYEVGMMNESLLNTSYRGLVVSEAPTGESHVPIEVGTELDYVQFTVVLASVERLRRAKKDGGIPFLTKSLKKVDPLGD